MKIMEKDILEEIVAAKRIEVARRKEAVGIGMLALRCEEREQGMDGNRNGEGRSMHAPESGTFRNRNYC